MRRVLATPDGRALYRRRQATIEPVFGQLKFNRQISRFQRRGTSGLPSRNGGSSPPPTTCSSSTATGSPPSPAREPPARRRAGVGAHLRHRAG